MADDINFLSVQNIAEATKKKEPAAPVPEETPKNDTPEFLAIKSTFIPSRGNIGGAFCNILEGKTGRSVFQVFWLASPYAEGVLLDPAKDWRNFVKRFPQLGPLDKNIAEKFQEQLKSILTIEEKKKLYENYTKVKVKQLESIIRRSFEQVSQCVFSAQTDVELIARPELERAKVIKPLPPSPAELARQKAEQEERERQEQEERDKQEASKDGVFEGTIIMCQPVLDPVKGKATSEIVPGDIVGVVIEGEGTSALVKKYLDENKIEPLFPVEEIKETAGKKFFYVKISDEIRGVLTITKDIKIKIKESEVTVKQRRENSSFMGDVIFFGMLGVAAIGLIFVIRYFFL